MRKRKHFVLREGISFTVQTKTGEDFGYPYENEKSYETFEEAVEDYMKRVKEYDWEQHELVITGRDKDQGISFVLTISNGKRKVEAGVSVDVEAIESEALEKLRKVEEIVKGV